MDLELNAKGGDSVGKLAMTMSAMAYLADAAAISHALSTNPLTKGRWSLVWYGVDNSTDWDANQAYVARDGITGQLAIAIRGSVTDPFSWAFWYDWFVEDLSAVHQADWPYGGAPAGARISQGSLKGLNNLLAIHGTNNQTLTAFLRANRTPTLMAAVMGHSLGGALSYVLAPYLHQEFAPGQDVLDYWPITFAAPTVGNPTYADWLVDRFVADAGRYHNIVDVVPHAWAGLQWILDSFPGPGEPKIPDALFTLVELIRLDMEVHGDHYKQPGLGLPLNGTLVKADDWIQEAGLQHAGATYLNLLGVQSIRDTIPASAGAPA
jgi:triacylglycerol lipase